MEARMQTLDEMGSVEMKGWKKDRQQRKKKEKR